MLVLDQTICVTCSNYLHS